MRALIFTFLVLSFFNCTRKDSITRFSEENQMERSYYIYPSTLRMVNLKQNQDYNDLIKDLVKGRYFSIKNNEENTRLIEELKSDLINEGFEEAMTIKSRGNDVVVFVLDNKVPKMAAIYKTPDYYNIADVEGMIHIAKIPALLENFNDEEFLNVIDITQQDSNRKHREHRTEDKQSD